MCVRGRGGMGWGWGWMLVLVLDAWTRVGGYEWICISLLTFIYFSRDDMDF